MTLRQASYSRDYARPVDEEYDGCIPRFHMEAQEVIIDGQKMYKDVEMVEVFFPGNPTTKPDFLVTEEFRLRWPKQYAAFKANQEAPLDGTPLEEWNILSRAQMLTLKSFEFRTIEDVAHMTENAIQRIGLGARQLKLKACAYLDQAEKNRITNDAIEQAARFEARCAEQDAQIARLNEQIAAFGDQFRTLAMQKQMDSQNVASTPHLKLVEQPPMESPVTSLGAFAKFAEENPESVKPATIPAGEKLTITPAQPAKRHRRTKAEMEAARAAGEV